METYIEIASVVVFVKLFSLSDGIGDTCFPFPIFMHCHYFRPDYIFSYTVVVTTKPGTMVDHSALIYLAGDDDVTTTRSYN